MYLRTNSYLTSHFLQATDFKTPSGNKFNLDNWGCAGFATERKHNVAPLRALTDQGELMYM